MFTPHQLRFFKRISVLLVVYSILRIGFYFYHLNLYKQFTEDEIFTSLLLGVRFDIAALMMVNAIPLLLTLIPTYNHKFLTFERVLFVLLNMAAIIIAVDDYELFLYLGKRLGMDLFVISDDILMQAPQLLKNYFYFPLIGILFAILFYFFDKKFFVLKKKKATWFSYPVGLLLLGLAFVGVRGGFQLKSINVQSAFVQGKNELGHLVLNSPYHFLRTLQNDKPKPLTYFASDDEAKNIILNRREFRDGITGKEKANVVLIILESFSLEYIEEGYAPFLSSLKEKGVFFPYHMANGRRSIEALPSLLCGLPSLLKEPISKSMYSGNKFSCFPEVLKKAGYTNSFFHAGSRGTMGFETYTQASGYHHYFSRDNYGDKDFDGSWGVFDGPYLEYFADEIGKMPEPFLASVFTLSSHQPYAIPVEHQGKFPKGQLEIHESIGYSDFALKNFFEKAKKTPWYENTYFIITADHSQMLRSKKFNNMPGRYRVPLLIVGPGLTAETRLKATQHSDIPRTILDLVQVEGELPATSVSAFAKDNGGVVNFADGSTYFLATNTSLQTLENDFSYDWETGDLGTAKPNEDPLLKAYLQYYLNGLIKNNLSLFR